MSLADLTTGETPTREDLDDLRDSVRRWARIRGEGAARRLLDSDAPASDTGLWREILQMGLLAVHLPAELGGGEAGLPGLAVVLEELAAELVPGPVLPTMLAAYLLAGSPVAAHRAMAGELGAGRIVAAVAVGRGSVRQEGSGWRLVAEVGPSVGLPDAEVVLVVIDGRAFLINVVDHGLHVERQRALDPTRSVGSVRIDDLYVVADALVAGVDEAVLANASAIAASAEAAGIASWCLDTAVEHAKNRVQFGRPIGAFQAVNHACVGLLVARDRCRALAWNAAEDPTDLATAAAGTIAPAAAVSAAQGCIQVLGAIGFTWEHDAHSRLRRALVNRHLSGDRSAWALRTLAAFGESPADVQTVHVPPSESTRHEVAALADQLARTPVERRRGVLADSGLLAPFLPPPYGRGATPLDQAEIATALREAGVEVPDLGIAVWAIASLAAAGTPEQAERFIPATLRGEVRWCQLFSEPEAGSDLSSVRTRAVAEEEGWTVTGQKIWTSRATEADWGICLCRAEDAQAAGITYVLIPMHDPQVRVRPIRAMTGRSRFAEVFLDGVVIGAENIVGGVGEGWKVARLTLETERARMSSTRFGTELTTLAELATRACPDEHPAAPGDVGAVVAEGIAVQALARLGYLSDEGVGSAPSAEVRKLVAMSYFQRTSELALELAGPEIAAYVDDDDSTATYQFLDTRGLSIGGGTTEILTTAVGERVLGLPRGRSHG